MRYDWEDEKNAWLKATRGVSFEQVVFRIAEGGVLALLEHPNSKHYPNQRIFVVRIEDYAYLVPFVEDNDEVFLKTIIPSRKMTARYLR